MKPQRARAIPLIGESGDTYTIIVRGHVEPEEYRRLYESELDRGAPEPHEIIHSWGRWIPVPPSRRHEDYPIKYFLHPAKPHSRGAFPYTENTCDLP